MSILRPPVAAEAPSPGAAIEPRQVGERSGSLRATMLPFLLLALSSLLWSGNWIVGRDLRDAMPPVALNFWRWTGALLIVAPFVLPRLAGRWHHIARHWRI